LFEPADEFFSDINALLRGVETWTLQAAFRDCIQQLWQCIEAIGDSLDGA
jgi:hypothetical protein